MAIDIKKMWSKDNFGFKSKDGLVKQASVVESYSYVTDPDDTYEDVANEPGVPQIGDQYLTFPTIRCTDKTWDRVSPVYWILTVTYTGNFGETGATSSATTQKPILSWSDTTTNEAIDEDFNGLPIATVNNEPIEGVTKDISDLLLTIERNYSFFDPATTHAYRDSTNSDTFVGFSPGVCRMVGFSANQEWDETGTNGYWRVSASFQFRYPYNTTPAKAWYKRIKHEGYYARPTPGGKIGPAFNELTKEAYTRPVLLKADGTIETNEANTLWLEFQLYDSLPYNALGLV